MADVERARLVERHEVAVMFKRVADEQTAITRGWAEVKKAVGSLRGRKFYGYSTAGGLSTGSVSSGATVMNQPYWGWKRGCFPAPATRRYAFKGSRLRFTNSSHRRSRDWRSARTVTRAGRTSVLRRRDVIDLLLPVK
jgi:hypothetical protein